MLVVTVVLCLPGWVLVDALLSSSGSRGLRIVLLLEK